jgi:4-hydroxythreonine-4-phosphate dehydrogenase
MLVISIGCPAGIGPEVSVAAADRVVTRPRVLVGDEATIRAAAELVGVPISRLVRFNGEASRRDRIYYLPVGRLKEADRRPGRPSKAAGRAELAWINVAHDLARAAPGRALVTGPVSKAVIARSGAPGADRFLGHTEWLRDRDQAAASVMCFVARRLVTSLATTHVPIARLSLAVTPLAVSQATVWLYGLLARLGRSRPTIAVCSLNPHAGESELLGSEEQLAIIPGIRDAARVLGAKARLLGPIGAETAYRKAYTGYFQGVVAMYHDQATIPTKLVAFGETVNVTMGLSVIRTSVDHGTGYDIAWQGKAHSGGMVSALRLGARLVQRSV